MLSKKKSGSRSPLVFSVIEELRRKGYNQTQIAEMHGVTRQAVSWQKVTYGGAVSTRQIVNEAWPWHTTHAHSRSKCFQRMRDHGEFMATGGRGMTDDKLNRLYAWWRQLRDLDVVLEFDPDLPPEKGISPNGGFAYRKRKKSDEDLLIRVNEYTDLSEEGRMIWCWPPEEVIGRAHV